MNTKHTAQPQLRLSVDASKAVYAQIIQLDLVITKQTKILDNAMLDIAEAQSVMATAWEKRDALAHELDRHAAAEFVPESMTKLPAPHPFAPAAPTQLGYAVTDTASAPAVRTSFRTPNPLPKRDFNAGTRADLAAKQTRDDYDF